MSNIIPSPDNWRRELSSLSTEQLKNQLVESLAVTAAQLVRSAAIVLLLEERGEDVEALKIGMLQYLRKIALAQLLPAVVVRFASKQAILDKITNLPLTEQKRLAEGEPIRLLVYDANGRQTHLMADPLKMGRDQMRQAFGKDYIRDEAEQLLFLAERREKTLRRARPEVEVVGKAKVDRVLKRVRVGQHVFSFDEWKAVTRLLGD